MTHIRIAIPCFGGLMHAQCAHSLTDLTHRLTSLGVEWSLDFELHESLVQRARNSLTHRFLTSEATHLLFIDADIVFRPIDVIGMLGAAKPVVCGAYPRKTLEQQSVIDAVQRGEQDPFAFAAAHNVNVLQGEPGQTETTLTADNGCVRIKDAATGFLLIQRGVLLKMIAAHPEWMHISDFPANRGEPMAAVWDCAIVEGQYKSEDWLFSHRWREMGGDVWLFLPAVLGHIGSYTYRGNLFTKFVPVQA